MATGGYMGKFLEVDLSTRTLRDFAVDADTLRRFLGGGGLAAWHFLDDTDPEVDPLAPENPLMIYTGPLVGTRVPGSSRFACAARSPLTGIWGQGACGGNFGVGLKATGWDGIRIVGRADEPLHLVLTEGRTELRSAGGYWGQDTYEVTRSVLASRDPALGKGTSVLCIGPAGENGVAYASIANDGSHFIGRTGMGAVMGAKQLKLITAKGKLRPPVADGEGLAKLRKHLNRQAREAMTTQSLRSMGTNAAMDLGVMTGDVPIKNWQQGEGFDIAQAIGGPSLTEGFLLKPHACLHCPVACKRVVAPTAGPGPYADDQAPGPEYETCGTFGTMILNDDLGAIIQANELCNRLGMDTITCGATIAWAMDCYERGLLSRDDLDGLELEWGRIDQVLALLPRIAARKGAGALLAEGSSKAAEKVGQGSERFTVHVKGLEAPMHDPRGFHGMGLGYAMGIRGACHLQHMDLYVEQGMHLFPDLDLEEDYEGPSSEGKAKMHFVAENLGVPAASACICIFVLGTMTATELADAIRLTTGWKDYDLDELLQTGQRIWLLQRGLDNLMGVREEDDRLPERILTPLEDGMVTGSVPDLERMKREYYALRSLDGAGIPTSETLQSSGLDTLDHRLTALRSTE